MSNDLISFVSHNLMNIDARKAINLQINFLIKLLSKFYGSVREKKKDAKINHS